MKGEVFGFVAVHLVPRFEHNDRFARVVALVVDGNVRERGLGHLLMGRPSGSRARDRPRSSR